MRKPRVPSVSFTVRVNVRCDRLRRRLQRELDVSAPALMEAALQALAEKRAEQAEAAA